MNTKIINIGEKNKTITQLMSLKEKDHGNVDIKISNLHLIKLNTLAKQTLFTKNDAYISAHTLYCAMNNEDNSNNKGTHNYHDLTIDDIYEGLKSISNPSMIFSSDQNRYLIVSLFISSFGVPLLVVIEVHADLVKDKTANINKIVTIYPKGDVNDLLKGTKEKLLYRN